MVHDPKTLIAPSCIVVCILCIDSLIIDEKRKQRTQLGFHDSICAAVAVAVHRVSVNPGLAHALLLCFMPSCGNGASLRRTGRWSDGSEECAREFGYWEATAQVIYAQKLFRGTRENTMASKLCVLQKKIHSGFSLKKKT